MEEDQALLQLLLSSLQILKFLIFPEFSADGSKVEVSISVAKLSALAQQSPVQTQHRLSAPRGHGGLTRTKRHTLANFQSEPGQTTVAPFFLNCRAASFGPWGSSAMQKMQKNNGGLEGECHAGAGTRLPSDQLWAPIGVQLPEDRDRPRGQSGSVA